MTCGNMCRPRAPVVLSVHDGAKRKYAHTLEMIQPDEDAAWVRAQSSLSNTQLQSCITFSSTGAGDGTAGYGRFANPG